MVGQTSSTAGITGFRWTAAALDPASGIRDLGVTNGTESDARGVSANGALVYGEARDSVGYWRAYRWTSSLGMRDLGTLGWPMSTAHAASADGSVIVGKSLATSSSGSLRAFRWTAATGMPDLRHELLNAGVTAVQDWTLAVAAGISDDGSVITGWGYPAPLTPAQPFIAVLPVTGGGGAVVALASSDTSVATVLSIVTVPAGATSATFTVSTRSVSSDRTVTISASYAGVTKTAPLTVAAGRW